MRCEEEQYLGKWREKEERQSVFGGDENVPKLIFGDGYTSLNRLEATEVYMVWNNI